MENYKASQPRFSITQKAKVVDIYRRRSFMGLSIWLYYDTILETGQTNKTLYLLNNPDEVRQYKLQSI